MLSCALSIYVLAGVWPLHEPALFGYTAGPRRLDRPAAADFVGLPL